MDRHAFLASLPYLIPLRSTAWPPQSGDTASRQRTNTVLLSDSYDGQSFSLSVELVLSNIENQPHKVSYAPLFFCTSKEANSPSNYSHSNDAVDPALSAIQLVLVGGSNDTEEPNSMKRTSQPNSLYARIDRHVYAVDLGQSKKILVVPESYETNVNDDDSAGGSYRRRKVSHPCSLVIEFESVVLRIFRNNLDVCREDKETLSGVCLKLSELENVVFQVENHECSSDGTSNETSTPGNDSSGSTTVDPLRDDGRLPCAIVDIPPATSPSRGNKRPIENDVAETIRRYRATYLDSLSCLRRTRLVLDTPTSVLPHTDDSDEGMHPSPSLSLNPLLNRSARLLSESFMPATVFASVDEVLGTQQYENEMRMEQILNSCFPAPQRNVRGRYSSQTNGTSRTMTTDPESSKTTTLVSGENAARSLALLMEEHRRIVEERHRMLLLGTRG